MKGGRDTPHHFLPLELALCARLPLPHPQQPTQRTRPAVITGETEVRCSLQQLIRLLIPQDRGPTHTHTHECVQQVRRPSQVFTSAPVYKSGVEVFAKKVQQMKPSCSPRRPRGESTAGPRCSHLQKTHISPHQSATQSEEVRRSTRYTDTRTHTHTGLKGEMIHLLLAW